MPHKIPSAASDLFPGDLRTEPPRGAGSKSRLNQGGSQRDPASLWDAVEAALEQRGAEAGTRVVAELTALAWGLGHSAESFTARYGQEVDDGV